MSHRVLFAYHHPTILHALTTLVERQGLGEMRQTLNAREAFRLAQKHQLGVAILDFEWPGANGRNFIDGLIPFSPKTGMVMTVHTDKSCVLDSLEQGIKGYVLTEGTVCRIPRPNTHLTERERQVIRLVADGYSTKQVAVLLGISVKTAEAHRTNIMEKLNVHETASLVRSAIRLGLVEP
jgi:DNA-binding NarL/FixJ family response regulator